jgi:hypothetical protein
VEVTSSEKIEDEKLLPVDIPSAISTPELSDAGGPERPDWEQTWPARIRSSDFVGHYCLRMHRVAMVNPANKTTETMSVNSPDKLTV